jgi:UDP-N-acetylmuramoyl-tripeptide--D-alanyl-D-alanine ligase
MRSRLENRVREEIAGPIIKALQPMLHVFAFVWRRLLVRTTVIGITGSLGKTTAKEALADVLAMEARTFRSYRNQNNTTGVALNILRIRPWHRYAVIEVAGAVPGMMKQSARILRPDAAIVLNVLRTHTTAFADLELHAVEKAGLLASVRPGGLGLVNADDALVSKMVAPQGVRLFSFGTSHAADYRVDNASAKWPGRLSFNFHNVDEVRRIETQFVGVQWLTSAAAVMAAAVSLGVSLDRAAAAVRGTAPFAARLQPIELPSKAIILRDDYSASIESIEPSLTVLGEAQAMRKILVITDMSDFGRNRKQRLKYLAVRAAEVANVVVFIGEIAEYGARRAVEAGIGSENAHAFSTLREAAEFVRGLLRPGDLMLLKGRTTDHATRIFFAQLGDVACWKDYCSKRMLCDTCWELGASSAVLKLTRAVPGDRFSPTAVVTRP